MSPVCQDPVYLCISVSVCVCVPCICERHGVRGGNGSGAGVAANDNGTALRINERHQKVIDSLSFVPVSVCAWVCANKSGRVNLIILSL